MSQVRATAALFLASYDSNFVNSEVFFLLMVVKQLIIDLHISNRKKMLSFFSMKEVSFSIQVPMLNFFWWPI